MDAPLLRAFQRQVWLQGKFALFAASIFDATANLPSADHDYGALIRLSDDEARAQSTEWALEQAIAPWAAIQAFLSAAANITKALWGESGKLSIQRKPLRDSLGVADTSPLRTTSMRNNFDHFDARLDRWWKDGGGTVADLCFGNPNYWVGGQGGRSTRGAFRNFDPSTGELIFWGQKYHLPTIVKEIERVTHVALRESVKPIGPIYAANP